MKKVLTFGCGGLLLIVIALLAVAWFVGSGVPREGAQSSRITLAAPPEEVWPLVADLEGQVAWSSMVESCEVTQAADGRTVYVQHTKFGRLPLTIVESVEPSRFKTEIVGDGMGWGGTWTWTLEPVEGGTRVTIVEDSWVNNPLQRFLVKKVMDPHMALDSVLLLLAGQTGPQGAAPEHVPVP
ncbi:MAG: SRPBCC family protein [Planctomycetes bacterium]|nr:SRPBCC family protein [Planctomycetota bacterium]